MTIAPTVAIVTGAGRGMGRSCAGRPAGDPGGALGVGGRRYCLWP